MSLPLLRYPIRVFGRASISVTVGLQLVMYNPCNTVERLHLPSKQTAGKGHAFNVQKIFEALQELAVVASIDKDSWSHLDYFPEWQSVSTISWDEIFDSF